MEKEYHKQITKSELDEKIEHDTHSDEHSRANNQEGMTRADRNPGS